MVFKLTGPQNRKELLTLKILALWGYMSEITRTQWHATSCATIDPYILPCPAVASFGLQKQRHIAFFGWEDHSLKPPPQQNFKTYAKGPSSHIIHVILDFLKYGHFLRLQIHGKCGNALYVSIATIP